MTPKRIIALAALVAVVLVIVVLALTRPTSRPAVPTAAPGTQAPGQSSSAATNPTTAGPGPGTAAGDRAAGKILDSAESFVKMYASQRWEDPEPGTWIDRASAYMTTDYVGKTRDAYGRAGGTAWAEFVQQRQIRKPVIRDSAISATSLEKATVVVSYTVTTSSQQDPTGSSQDFTKLLTLRTETGGWKVSGISDLVSGYAPPTVEQQTPEVAPTVGH